MAEYIEGVVEPSYKKPTRKYSKPAGHSRQKRVEADSSQTYPAMGDSNGKRRKQYVDRPSGESRTCLIHVPGNYFDECKVLGDFGAKYGKGNPTKDRRNITVTRKNLTGRRKSMPLLIMWWMKFY